MKTATRFIVDAAVLTLCLATAGAAGPVLAAEASSEDRAASLFRERFPDADPKFLVFDEMVIPVQVDGKLRDRVSVPRTATEDDVKRAALESAGVAAYLAGRQVAKVIYVKGRLLNIVMTKEE